MPCHAVTSHPNSPHSKDEHRTVRATSDVVCKRSPAVDGLENLGDSGKEIHHLQQCKDINDRGKVPAGPLTLDL
eukprot:scaffold57899_cov18-Tisochrysis_lutea.AAC.1